MHKLSSSNSHDVKRNNVRGQVATESLIFNTIHLGVFILNYAKLRMLEFYYDCVDKYLSREDFEMVEMDTDSNYLGISSENVEELIKPKLREEFEKDKHNWFVTPLAPQGKRTPWPL